MPKAFDLDVILPCFNPLPDWHKHLEHIIDQLRSEYPDQDMRFIVSNDGTTNGRWTVESIELAKSKNNVLLLSSHENKGKGSALRRGVAESESPYCIITDVDFPYSLESFKSILDALMNNDCDLVIGERKANYYKKVPFARKLLSKGFRFLLKLIYSFSIRDSQCGLKGFNRAGKKAFMATETDRYLIDLEFLILASKNRLKIKPVGVELREDVQFTRMGFALICGEFVSLVSILAKGITLNMRGNKT